MRRGLFLGLALLVGACGGQQEETWVDVARAMSLPEDIAPICGDPRLLGREIDPIGRRGGGCGIAEPVQVFAVDGVRLSPAARINCETAATVQQWMSEAAKPAASELGTELTSMRVAASYACRRRNHRSSGRLSEHAKGNAIDFSEFRFADGREATVLGDWRRSEFSGFLRAIHKAACGPFGVTLGPGSDGHHEDHFHYDISNRNRPYCR